MIAPVQAVPAASPKERSAFAKRDTATTYIRGVFKAPAPTDADYPAARVLMTLMQERLWDGIRTKRALDKDLEAKKSGEASQLTRTAEQIVSQASKQASGKGGDADKAKSLDAVLKDIREAEKQIANRKPDDASTAIKSAITGLEALTGAKKKK